MLVTEEQPDAAPCPRTRWIGECSGLGLGRCASLRTKVPVKLRQRVVVARAKHREDVALPTTIPLFHRGEAKFPQREINVCPLLVPESVGDSLLEIDPLAGLQGHPYTTPPIRSSARTPAAAPVAGSRQGQIVLAALHDASDVDVIATFETVLGAAATPSAAQR